MPSKLALEYQEKKINKKLHSHIREPIQLLDQKFNCVRLLEIASNAVGQKCLSAEAVAAVTGYSASFDFPLCDRSDEALKVYLLTFEDSRTEAVARVVHTHHGANAEEIADRLNSEIATVAYIRAHTTVPVPKIIYSTSDIDGEGVGAPFSIQERVRGHTLCKVTDELGTVTPEQRELLIKTLAEFEAQLVSIKLSGIGCLYQDSEGKFVVGRRIPQPGELPSPERGPWTSAKDYLNSMITRELNVLKNRPEDWINHHSQYIFDDMILVDVDTMKRYYAMLAEVVNSVEFPDSPSGIAHADWDGFNIILDEDDYSKVNGIIDWDYTQVMPAWFYNYDWGSSVVPNLARRDDIDHQILQMKRLNVVKENATEIISLQKRYWHLAYLAAETIGFPCYAEKAQVEDFVRDLASIWPKDTSSFKVIDEFLRSI